jgi:signal transduction histidine kinase
MSETLDRLKAEALLALESGHPEQRAAHLSKAFALFSTETERLKIAYHKLQERFEAVNGELAQKGSYLTNLLKHIQEGILTVDLEGTITLCNEMGKKLLRLQGPEGFRFWTLFADEALGFSMREALRYGISHKLIYAHHQGQDLEVSTHFLFEGPKSHHSLIVLVRDISQLQRLQRLIHHADRMKELGAMAASLAHEIRNPLGGIRGFASLLHRDLAGDPKGQEMAAAVIEGSRALERLVTSVLEYARPLEIRLETSELGALLSRTIRHLKADPAYPPHVEIFTHIPKEPFLAPVDEEHLKRALLNLSYNAIQAMPKGGTLTFSLLSIGPMCQIGICDTGLGMDEETQAKLFAPLFTTKQGGNGLGLVEVQKIVQAHGGSIEVRSQKGKGTTFLLTLPQKRG